MIRSQAGLEGKIKATIDAFGAHVYDLRFYLLLFSIYLIRY